MTETTEDKTLLRTAEVQCGFPFTIRYPTGQNGNVISYALVLPKGFDRDRSWCAVWAAGREWVVRTSGEHDKYFPALSLAHAHAAALMFEISQAVKRNYDKVAEERRDKERFDANAKAELADFVSMLRGLD